MLSISAPRLSPLPAAPLVIGIGLLLTCLFWGVAGVDMRDAYLPWFNHIRATGQVAAFSRPFSDYMPPYLYALALAVPLAGPLGSYTTVKLVSCAGHLLLALAVRRLLVVTGCRWPGRAAALIALAPSLFLNPAILVQCDAYWAAPLVVALSLAAERRTAGMFLWCGIAVAIKLQAAFAGPVFLAIAIAYRAPARLWLFAPIGFAMMLLPAWLAGWPVGDLLSIYLRQVDFSSRLALNAPNIWMIAESLPLGLTPAVGTIGSLTAVAASIAYVVVLSRRLREVDPAFFLQAVCLGALIVPGLLPRMHERYFFFADVMTLALMAVRPATWRVAGMVQFGSTAAILAYIFGAPGLAILGAGTMIAATWMLARSMWQATELRRVVFSTGPTGC